jgi:YHS domain-containing protein
MSSAIRRSSFPFLVLMLAARAAFAGEFFETDGAALRGYDPVAYFDSGQPTKGAPQFRQVYRGSTFLFASAGNQHKFAADPIKYAPQYGGFCAYGTANGYKVSTQPDAFRIVDGKLYLNHDTKVQEIWLKDVPGNIARADEQWPEVAKKELTK